MTRPLLLACLVSLAAALAPACSTVRPIAAAGVVAALDCEAAHLDAQALADAKAFASAKVQAWISGSGAAFSAAIKADLAPIKSDLGRCAIAGAMALIGTAVQSSPGVAVQGLMATPETDPAVVRTQFSLAARQLGWPPVAVGGAVL
jgi:hypothetical protein